MAVDKTGLQPIGGQSKAGNAPQMWSYKSADAIADVNTEGYFNDASDVLKVGDLIVEAQKRNIKSVLELNNLVNAALKTSSKTILIAVINDQNQKRYIGVKLK